MDAWVCFNRGLSGNASKGGIAPDKPFCCQPRRAVRRRRAAGLGKEKLGGLPLVLSLGGHPQLRREKEGKRKGAGEVTVASASHCQLLRSFLIPKSKATSRGTCRRHGGAAAGFVAVPLGSPLGGPGRLEGNEQELTCTWKNHPEWGGLQ